MDLIANLALGFSTALTPVNLAYCFMGVLIGTFIGVLPGIGPLATLSMLLPLTYHLEPTASLIMLAGIYYGSQYGGSTTAILVNLPGEISSAVTAIDGYKMSMKGRGGAALAIAAIGSFVAGTFATLMIAVFAIPLTSIALEIGAPEYFALIVLGFVASTALARGSLLKSLGMILLGMLFGMVGSDAYSGAFRFHLGIINLTDGIELVAMALGFFGVAEILRNLETMHITIPTAAKITSLMPTRAEIKASIYPILRATGMGTALGILPGGGVMLAVFASYATEKRLSKTPERFGEGAIEGVAGPEAANNAAAQTAFVPMLTLGLPSTPTMALMIGAMMVHGIQPGPRVSVEQPALFWGIICSMWIGNAMLVILNLPLVGIWIKLLRIPYTILFPSIIVLSIIGIYTVNNDVFDLWVLAAFGVFAYSLIKLGCEPAPFLLGSVLGPMLEIYMRRSLSYSHGDPMIFITQPISAGLLTVAAITLILAALPAMRGRRKSIFADDDD